LPAQSTSIKERHGASFFVFNQFQSGTLLRPVLAGAFPAISGRKGGPVIAPKNSWTLPTKTVAVTSVHLTELWFSLNLH
jgi:hypothetical protein